MRFHATPITAILSGLVFGTAFAIADQWIKGRTLDAPSQGMVYFLVCFAFMFIPAALFVIGDNRLANKDLFDMSGFGAEAFRILCFIIGASITLYFLHGSGYVKNAI